MKRVTVIFCVLFSSIFGYGQDKKFGITLQINSPSKDDVNLGWYNVDSESIDGYNLKHKSFAVGLLANYTINEQTIIRLRFGMTRNFINEYQNIYYSDVYHVESVEGAQVKTQFAPGIVWKMNKNKLDFFGGFEIPFNIHGQFESSYSNTETDLLSGIITKKEQSVTVLPQGHSFGIGAVMGFNYFPAKWFSVGAEFSPSLLYAKLSGETEITYSSTVPFSPAATFYTQDEDKGFTFYEQRFSINLSVWF